MPVPPEPTALACPWTPIAAPLVAVELLIPSTAAAEFAFRPGLLPNTPVPLVLVEDPFTPKAVTKFATPDTPIPLLAKLSPYTPGDPLLPALPGLAFHPY